MKEEEIYFFAKNRISAAVILVYYTLRQLCADDNKVPTHNILQDYLPLTTSGTISKSLAKLLQCGAIVMIKKNNNHKNKEIFFPVWEKDVKLKILEKTNERKTMCSQSTKKLLPLKCGIYKVTTLGGIYIGQSKDLYKRWKSHKASIKNGTHRYFKGNSDEYCFEVLEECKISKLRIKENLWAQRLIDQGKKIININNFTLLEENK